MEYVRIDSESGDEREMCLKVEQDLKALGELWREREKPETLY